MVLGNIERLEVVVRRLHLRPGNHGVAERKKNPLDLLERLPQRVPRAERADDAGKREVFALARERRLFGRGFDRRAPRFERRFDVRFQFIERLADGALQLRLRGLEPVLGDLRKHAGFAAEPGVAQQISKLPVILAAATASWSELCAQLREQCATLLVGVELQAAASVCSIFEGFVHRSSRIQRQWSGIARPDADRSVFTPACRGTALPCHLRVQASPEYATPWLSLRAQPWPARPAA